MKASAWALIAVVVFLHVAAIGALVFIQGCGTTRQTGTPSAPPQPVMPPTTPEAVQYPAPVSKPELPPPMPSEPAPVRAEETTEYVVQPRDTLGGIARQCHVSVAELMALNKIADPKKLRVNQKLLLPGKHTLKPAAPKAAAAKPAAKAAVPAAVPAAPGGTYIVKKGDVLSRIAKQHGVGVAALKAANNLADDKIRVDQKLVIPKPGETPAAAAPAPAAAPAVNMPPAVPELPPAQAPAPAAPAASEAPALVSAAVGEAPVVPGAGVVHTVIAGEDLDSIAKLYVVTRDELMAANQIAPGQSVTPGQRLNIP